MIKSNVSFPLFSFWVFFYLSAMGINFSPSVYKVEVCVGLGVLIHSVHGDESIFHFLLAVYREFKRMQNVCK